jgi:hypothetical protein
MLIVRVQSLRTDSGGIVMRVNSKSQGTQAVVMVSIGLDLDLISQEAHWALAVACQ